MDVTPPVQRRNVEDDRVDILIHQFYIAASLYLHEDQLNWQKLHHLLYINVGLGAVTGFVLENGMGNVGGIGLNTVFLILGAIGIMVAFAFGVAIWFGTLYLQNRKAALAALEESLAEHGGEAVVNLPPHLQVINPRFARVSPTVWVLRLFPVLLALLWSGLLLRGCFSFQADDLV